jgi:hypothetical protein
MPLDKRWGVPLPGIDDGAARPGVTVPSSVQGPSREWLEFEIGGALASMFGGAVVNTVTSISPLVLVFPIGHSDAEMVSPGENGASLTSDVDQAQVPIGLEMSPTSCEGRLRRKIPCRRRLRNTTRRQQNTLRMSHGTIRKRPNTTRRGITRRQLTMLTQRWGTRSTLEGMLKKQQRLMPRTTARNSLGIDPNY